MDTKEIVHDLTMALLSRNVTVSSPCELVSEYNKLFAEVEKEFKSQRKQASAETPARNQLNGL